MYQEFRAGNFSETVLRWLRLNRGVKWMDYRGEHGSTLLHWAVWWNRPDIVYLLIQKGANVNAFNKLGQHPLMWSVRAEPKIHKMLLEAGSSVMRKDVFGLTAERYYFRHETKILFQNVKKEKYLNGSRRPIKLNTEQKSSR